MGPGWANLRPRNQPLTRFPVVVRVQADLLEPLNRLEPAKSTLVLLCSAQAITFCVWTGNQPPRKWLWVKQNCTPNTNGTVVSGHMTKTCGPIPGGLILTHTQVSNPPLPPSPPRPLPPQKCWTTWFRFRSFRLPRPLGLAQLQGVWVDAQATSFFGSHLGVAGICFASIC